VLARYRYRLYPGAAQRQALARAFGCARVVFNNAIRVREEACERGEKLSDTEVQRRVITLAKVAPEREWLGGRGWYTGSIHAADGSRIASVAHEQLFSAR
jgi:transposase